jgi:hypothetical protein
MFNKFSSFFESKKEYDDLITELIEYLEANPKSIFPKYVAVGDGKYFIYKVFSGQEKRFPKSLKPRCKYEIEIYEMLWIKISSSEDINGRFMITKDVSKSVFEKFRTIVEKRFQDVKNEDLSNGIPIAS